MAYLALVSATEGRRLGLAATAGVALGLLVIGAAAALGLAALVGASAVAFQAMRRAGVLYLLWLAWEAWAGSGEVSPARVGPAPGPVRYFRRGFITNLLNPKAALFFLAVLPGFVDPASAVLPQRTVLTSLYVGVATWLGRHACFRQPGPGGQGRREFGGAQEALSGRRPTAFASALLQPRLSGRVLNPE